MFVDIKPSQKVRFWSLEVPDNERLRQIAARGSAQRPIKDACASVGCASMVLSSNKKKQSGGGWGGNGLYNWDRMLSLYI